MAKKAVLIQARMSSQRFPGKMLKEIAGIPLIEYVNKRCCQAKVDVVAVITSDDVKDNGIFNLCQDRQIPVFRGDLQNVLKRYVDAAAFFQVDEICRVCGDTPLVDIAWIDQFFEILSSQKLDYVSFNRETWLSGFYSEVFTVDSLQKAAKITSDAQDQEHVTRYIVNMRQSFRTLFLNMDLKKPDIDIPRLTVDYPPDLEVINTVINALDDKFVFTSQDIIKVLGAK